MNQSPWQPTLRLPGRLKGWVRPLAERGQLPSVLGVLVLSGFVLLYLLFVPVSNWVRSLRIPVLDRWYQGLPRAWQVAVSQGLFLVGLLLSLAVAWWIYQRLPIRFYRVNGEWIVAWRREDAASIQRGDWVAYRPASRLTIALEPERVAVEQVLAVAGDRVRFTSRAMEVNGQALPRTTTMPSNGGLVVPAGDWFIWPVFGQPLQGHGGSGSRNEFQDGLVSTDRYLGRVGRPWLGRRRLVYLQAMEQVGKRHG